MFMEVTRLEVMNKGKVVAMHVLKASRGNGGVALRILNPGTRWW
jgi:hypothetical protein